MSCHLLRPLAGQHFGLSAQQRLLLTAHDDKMVPRHYMQVVPTCASIATTSGVMPMASGERPKAQRTDPAPNKPVAQTRSIVVREDLN